MRWRCTSSRRFLLGVRPGRCCKHRPGIKQNERQPRDRRYLIETSSRKSLPPFTVSSRTSPTPRAYHLLSSTPGSSSENSLVCTALLNDPYGTLTDAVVLRISAQSSATLLASSCLYLSPTLGLASMK